MRTFMLIVQIAVSAVIIAPLPARALEVVLRPAEYIHSTPAHIGRGMYETMLHSILLHAAKEEATLSNVSITLMALPADGKHGCSTRKPFWPIQQNLRA